MQSIYRLHLLKQQQPDWPYLHLVKSETQQAQVQLDHNTTSNSHEWSYLFQNGRHFHLGLFFQKTVIYFELEDQTSVCVLIEEIACDSDTNARLRILHV